jgi:hypothetical protein
MVPRAPRRREQPRIGKNLRLNNTGWHGKVVHRRARERAFHHVMPDRRRAANPRDVPHRRIVRVTHPHPDQEVGCITDHPIVAEIVGCACLDRRIARLAGTSHHRAIAVIMPSVALMSAFARHMTTTAVMLPVTLNLSRERNIPTIYGQVCRVAQVLLRTRRSMFIMSAAGIDA